MSVTVKPSYHRLASVIQIKTKRKYSAEELLELIGKNVGKKYGPLEIRKKALLGDVVAVKGVNPYEIFVIPSGNKVVGHGIMIMQEKKMSAAAHTMSGCAFGIIAAYPVLIFDILTLGVRNWQIWGVRKNWHIMKPLSEDIARLVDG